MTSRVNGTLATLLLLFTTMVFSGCEDTAPKPRLETAKAKSESCVEPTGVMRRTHMDFIKHQRDETMYKGIRTQKHSFKECINCHVPDKKDGKPVNYLDSNHNLNPDHFCATCHAYVGVKIDCFECHSDNPAGAAPVDANHAVGGSHE
ncbi:MAG: hypothetical protein KAH22_09970 [Thiotrichaceae bacterium]|nr:hypothetical protein [Thiotrichaceae bacterium]